MKILPPIHVRCNFGSSAMSMTRPLTFCRCSGDIFELLWLDNIQSFGANSSKSAEQRSLSRCLTRRRLCGRGCEICLVKIARGRNAHVPQMWEQASQYLPHAVSILTHAEALGIITPQIVDLLIRSAGFLVEKGFKDQAKLLGARAHKYGTSVVECSPRQRADSILIFAYVLNYNPDYVAAAPLYEEALALDMEQFGLEDENTLTSLHNWAGIQKKHGQIDEARLSFEKVVASGKRMSLDREDGIRPYASMISLGEIYRESGKFKLAESLMKEAEEGFRRKQKDDSSWTLYAELELGKTLLEVSIEGFDDRWEEAKGKLESSKVGLEKVLGIEDTYAQDAKDSLQRLISSRPLMSSRDQETRSDVSDDID